MVAWRLGSGLALRPWLEPGGLLLGLFLLASAPLLHLLSPHATLPASTGSLPGLLLLALLAGAALALVALARRASLLELAALPERLLTQSVALVGAALVAALLVLLGAGGDGWAAPALWLALPIAAVHLAGLGLPLLAAPLPGAARAALFFTAAWWLPALLLEPRGFQGWLQRILEPGLALQLGSSESASLGAILPAALLAGSVFLAGLSTALSATRTG